VLPSSNFAVIESTNILEIKSASAGFTGQTSSFDSKYFCCVSLIWPLKNKLYLIQFYRMLGDPGNELDQQGYRLEVQLPSDTE
jgi:hypothetical protein